MRWSKSGQREVLFPKKRGWGGARTGAGRHPKGPRAGVSHGRREIFDGARHPLLVTLRVRPEIGTLRREELKAVIFESIRAANGRGVLRVTDFSVLSNHLHLIVEALDAKALSRGMQGLKIRIAKAINRALGRQGGTVFADRYHVRVLGTPTEVRHALLYVINNVRKHLAERRLSTANDWVDPFSSGGWFDGWRTPPSEPAEAPPVASPTTWLRREGWRRAGPPFRFYETPGSEPEP